MDWMEGFGSPDPSHNFTDDPVADDEVAAILDDARFAPSGGNRQPWHVVVVKDATIRRTLAELMTDVWQEYLGEGEEPGRAPFAFGRSASDGRRVAAAN